MVLAFKSIFWKSATPKGKYIGYASQQKGEYYMFIDISECAAQPTLLALVSGEHVFSSTNYYYVTIVFSPTN